MSQMDLLSVIKFLPATDKRRVEKAYKVLFPDASETRYRNIVSIGSTSFDSKEENVLSKLFIEVNGRWKLNGTDEFFQLIGEELPMAL